MKTTPLESGWQVRVHAPRPYHRPQSGDLDWIEASVPGHVHQDLIRAGIIVDPFEGLAEAGSQWVGETDWVYRCAFQWSPDPACPRRVLRFEGIDTVATVSLNGQTIGRTDNFFVPYECDVTDRLTEGENVIEVLIESAVRVGEGRRAAYFDKEGLPTETIWFDERAFVRKPGYMSGWDWGPRLVSAGIWRPVSLLEFASRLVNCTVDTTPLGGDKFKVTVTATTEGPGDLSVTWDGAPMPAQFTVEGGMWWPNGEGTQTLHDVTVSYGGDTIRKKIGLRTAELVREPDEVGTSFEFRINGRPVWARGANWIPNDSFPSRVTRQDLDQAIDRYATLGVNMLRVWGGGLYETEEFYDACDRHGIMVWQDFPYACSYYPDGVEEQATAKQEAAYHVRRLRDRASLVLWCGNNENRSMYYGKWLGPGTQPPRFYGENLYESALKQAVVENDPTRPYIESSPVLTKGMPGVDSPTLNSDDHYWDVWHGRGDWAFYAESDTRFSSEFGFASACTPLAWRRAGVSAATPSSSVVRWHDKTNKPWDTFRTMVELHYPPAKTLADWIYTSQLNQRDAMVFAIEHYRSNPACRGALIWQINDCWPVQSWALEDYARQVKPAGFALARIFAPVLVAIRKTERSVQVTLCNDASQPLTTAVTVAAIDTVTGHEKVVQSAPVLLDAHLRARVIEVDTQGFDPVRTALCVTVDGHPECDRWLLLAEPKDACFGPVEVCASQEHGQLVVEVSGFVVDLTVTADCALVDAETGLQGTRAWTGRDLKLRFEPQAPLSGLTVRSLAGEHSLSLVASNRGTVPTR